MTLHCLQVLQYEWPHGLFFSPRNTKTYKQKKKGREIQTSQEIVTNSQPVCIHLCCMQKEGAMGLRDRIKRIYDAGSGSSPRKLLTKQMPFPAFWCILTSCWTPALESKLSICANQLLLHMLVFTKLHWIIFQLGLRSHNVVFVPAQTPDHMSMLPLVSGGLDSCQVFS